MKNLLAWTQRAPGMALAVYWIIAFIATHIPSPWEPSDTPPRRLPLDKVGHFVGYAVLAWLLMNLLGRRMRPLAAAGLTMAIVVVYGAFDELTQPMFNRTADLPDYTANLAGGLAGSVFGMWRARQGEGDPVAASGPDLG